jgi:hypothetical protein
LLDAVPPFLERLLDLGSVREARSGIDAAPPTSVMNSRRFS